MSEIKISKEFTIDDIHKIREHNYETTKNMSVDELRVYYKKSADEGERRINALKAAKTL